jgi:hypothetical protein
MPLTANQLKFDISARRAANTIIRGQVLPTDPYPDASWVGNDAFGALGRHYDSGRLQQLDLDQRIYRKVARFQDGN